MPQDVKPKLTGWSGQRCRDEPSHFQEYCCRRCGETGWTSATYRNCPETCQRGGLSPGLAGKTTQHRCQHSAKWYTKRILYSKMYYVSMFLMWFCIISFTYVISYCILFYNTLMCHMLLYHTASWCIVLHLHRRYLYLYGFVLYHKVSCVTRIVWCCVSYHFVLLQHLDVSYFIMLCLGLSYLAVSYCIFTCHVVLYVLL